MAKLQHKSISKRTVGALKVEKDTVFWDSELIGFGVRVYPNGAAISFKGDESLSAIEGALARAALHYPLPVTFNGRAVDRRAFLDGAVHVEPWRGIMFGAFKNGCRGYNDPDLNFHGLTLPVRLPHIVTLDSGTWTVRADIASCPELELVLAARKEAVETSFLEEMRDAARLAMYRAVAHADPAPRLVHEDWSRARDAGTGKPDAGPYDPWAPHTVRIEGAKAHPTPLVQSAAMAAVSHPAPDYRPMLPERIAADGLLSDAQLESVILAGQAHDGRLNALYRIAHDWETVERADIGNDDNREDANTDADSGPDAQHDNDTEGGAEALSAPVRSRQSVRDPGPDQGQGDAQSERSLGRHLRSRRTQGHADSR